MNDKHGNNIGEQRNYDHSRKQSHFLIHLHIARRREYSRIIGCRYKSGEVFNLKVEYFIDQLVRFFL